MDKSISNEMSEREREREPRYSQRRGVRRARKHVLNNKGSEIILAGTSYMKKSKSRKVNLVVVCCVSDGWLCR
jgi:hypothetical protein